MIEIKQKILNKAHTKFLVGDFETFVLIIKNLYQSHLTCNCFFRKQPELFWNSLIKTAEELDDDFKDFNLNFSKGFIYLRNQNNEKAFKYLSIAIELDATCDICFSIRSESNKHKNLSLEDAKEAVSLNPSARNYFILSNETNGCHYEPTDPFFFLWPIPNSIEFYDKALSIDKRFACAYNNKGKAYQALNEHSNAVDSFLKCIEIEPAHFCYYDLCISLNSNLNGYCSIQ